VTLLAPLCARSPSLVREIALVLPTAWRRVELDVPTRKLRGGTAPRFD
jgi:hypothetical protein